ncbi:head-tail adaptor protein [Pseudooceanicola sp. CBS1P-1]|uniref:Head-tail adaptor protein n=1 Tax=Pseudooceanicola albus TaxID=2692189 RepID=A0A6L7G9G8_9RHOB|nr:MULTISPECIES: head-tail adaptor protein [Pseudooceanicola]MBT9384252.1 head-tail adaptor protein [Pseudooceanicola endophyticus]MXN20844.1 head-tail adaptor protein [Pseudooceanicola albus]
MSPRLNRKLVLEARSHVDDGAGGSTTSWIALGTLWGEIAARSGGPGSEGGQQIHAQRVRITVRGAPVGATNRPVPGERFLCDGHVYLIDAVSEADAGGQYLTCLVHEELAP